MATVAIRDVRKRFGAVEVLRGVSLRIDDGEFVALVGPSGCGKSTLLRMIAGLEHITGGEIVIDGKVVNNLSPKDRDIAMVFQSYALYPHMTVAENMAFSLKLKGVSSEIKEERVKAAATLLNLTEKLDQYPRQLSGGQRQRVAMGRAIIRNPKVFLFDEPLSNLDAKLRVSMRAEIKGLHQRLKTTTIYVTHDQVEAMTMADKIVVMNQGVIEQVGAPLELYDTPRNLFVASFIGSPAMNFFDGTIEQTDGGAVFVAADQTKFSIDPKYKGSAGRQAVLGVRPEHFIVGDDGHPAEVMIVEPTGAETFVVARLAGELTTVLFKDRRPLAVGQTIRLKAEPEHQMVFDKATGERLAA